MGLLNNGFREIKKASEPLYKTPKSIQQTIEIMKVAENGIFEVSKNHYSKSYIFSDINYTTTTEAEQLSIIERYCKLLNTFDCETIITKNNKNRDMQQVRNVILGQTKGDKYDVFVEANNEIIEDKIREGRQGIEQEMYLTITIERKTFEEAKVQFATIEATLQNSYRELGSEIRALSGNERLEILHDFYHLGSEDEFTFDIREAKKVGADFKNDICNGMVKYYPDHFEDESKYCRALFFKKYPSGLSDRFLNEITSLPVHMITSLSIVPVPKDVTTKILQNKYMGIESDIIRQQRVRNKNNDFSSDISYVKRTEKKEIENIMDDVRENDQCLFYVAVTIIIVAESMEELNSITETIETIGKKDGVGIDIHYYKQREALNTALPIGVRHVETMRSMLTQSVAALLPFNVQELNSKYGLYYGINQISKNILIGNRKFLLNGNGFVFGVPGGGKSFFCKQEMGQVFLNTGDHIIVIDPMSEYFDLAKTYGGTVVNMSAYTKNYVNPLDCDIENINEKGIREVITDKSEFMLSVCDQLLGNTLNQKHHSIIDRCIRELYMMAYRKKEVPLMTDFYNILKKQDEMEAQELALSLELFVEGSLNIFNHHTNIDENNRFIVYGIQDLGTQLAPVAMLVMMEAIQSKIIENGRNGIATWLYVDECHVLLNSDYSATYLQQLWKKVRKQGGLCTGISQNVTDLLQNYIAATLISNSEFITLLKQSNIDSAKLAEVIGVSDAQLRYVSNSPFGTGLIKFGNTVIPFDNTISKESKLYKLYNTNLHEKIAMGLTDENDNNQDYSIEDEINREESVEDSFGDDYSENSIPKSEELSEVVVESMGDETFEKVGWLI